jgi:hypothetical protein
VNLERPGKRREEAHAWHAAELVRRRRRWASAGRDGGALTMRGIEIAVDGGGGDGRRRRNGRGRGRREMGSVHLIFLILMREIFHILQEFINRSGNQKR